MGTGDRDHMTITVGSCDHLGEVRDPHEMSNNTSCDIYAHMIF